MRFRTEIEVGQSDMDLSIDKPVALVGSCFADNISARMRRCLWRAENPLGVLFNPLSIANALRLTLLESDASDLYGDYMFAEGEVCHSWLFDSTFSGHADTMRNRFFASKQKLDSILEAGRTLIVTFGTAYCYFLKSRRGFVVSNCHKQPQSLFERRRVEVDDIVEIWHKLAVGLRHAYPGLRIIFTVSPVRHVRDGLHENQLSKATLLLAIDRICGELDFCEYFPAYEAVNDDLRDYRFYAADLVHPSEMAVEYIWEKFQERYVADDNRRVLTEGEKIAKRLSHRPIIAESESAVAFREATADLYAKFAACHPAALNLKDLGIESAEESRNM